MSGKAYTMKEMKGIVDYLVEHSAYKDLKGRKMWMNFANSQHTNRTWQSLKETFLKRILPDIHNPYYKLTVEQICSFKQGYDIHAREKNKLEIQTISEDSSSNGENQKETEEPSTSKNIEEGKTGEDITCSKITHTRASVETVIIENCYETAEDVQRVLESPNTEENGKPESPKPPVKSKSIRDLITYSEPLTPMLQEVLDDFATDDDSDSGEPRMQIVENVPDSQSDREAEKDKEKDKQEMQSSEEAKTEYVVVSSETEEKNTIESNDSENFVPPKIKSLKLKKREAKTKTQEPAKSPKKTLQSPQKEPSTSSNGLTETVAVILDNLSKTVNKTTKTNRKNLDVPTQTSLVSMDSVLPNNQEALNKSCDTKDKQSKNESNIDTSNKNTIVTKHTTRKRAISQDVQSKSISKQKKESAALQKQVSLSDTDVVDLKKIVTVTKSGTYSSALANKIAISAQNDDIYEPSRTPAAETAEKEATSKNEDKDIPTVLSQSNPCLQSVSLFAEQFNTTKYVNSESSNHDDSMNAKNEPRPSGNTEKMTVDIVNEVVILKSHSESGNEDRETQPKKNSSTQLPKAQRNKVLANVFGFSSGTVSNSRKKSIIHHKSSSKHHYMQHNTSLESSEWTSESDSDYVSPPRGRRNRQTRKYLKPHSARIHSLEEEGGLFVMYGKKIYPLVKDGKIIKNYLTYLSESEPEEEESYWKLKYVEERQRVEELKKLINQGGQDIVREKSPVLPSKPSRRLRIADESNIQSRTSLNNVAPEAQMAPEKEPFSTATSKETKTLKITFAKNNQEMHLEGHWSQLHPVLADVVQIFNQEPPAAAGQTSKTDEGVVPSISIASTPVEENVHEKVNKLEKEIFKEIEERAKEENAPKELSESNITKRKRPNRVRKISMSTQTSSGPVSSPSSPRSPKRFKRSIESESEDRDEESGTSKTKEVTVQAEVPKNTENKKSKTEVKTRSSESFKKVPRATASKDVDNSSTKEMADDKEGLKEDKSVSSDTGKSKSSTGSKKKTSKKVSTESIITTDSKTRSTRRSKTAFLEKEQFNVYEDTESSQVRYMFPPEKMTTRKSALSLSKKVQTSKRYTLTVPKKYSLDLSLNSESTQGYLDSDGSPPRVRLIRRKRKLSLSTVLYKNKNRQRIHRRSYPLLTNDNSSDSNCSFHLMVKPKNNNSDSSLKSEVYRSESYQLLMPSKQLSFRPLEKIDEQSPMSKTNDTPNNTSNVDSDVHLIASQPNTDGANSSNVTLPPSPELSIVEKLSISKELLNSSGNHPTLNETQANDTSQKVVENKYFISEVDVSMPLMQQECELQKSIHDFLQSDINLSDYKKSSVDESLLNKVNTVNIKDPSLTETLNTRLENLLLESAKKMSIVEEIDAKKAKVDKKAKKTKNSKRCSTPRKKKGSKKAKVPTVDPVVEEEFMESCSYGGRKSCPPVIQNIDFVNNEEIVPKQEAKAKKKKDIIKVKILRPRVKSFRSDKSPKKSENMSKISIPTDSGINESGSALSIQDFNDSIDLIHNHSETCLHANECIADSLEFIETNTKSVISISDSTRSNECLQSETVFKDCEELLAEMFCENAQDAANVARGVTKLNRGNTDNTGDTVYHSPIKSEISNNSLMTEDLSDENAAAPSQATKWYLLSEHENTSTNQAPNFNTNFGAHLKQLFPITCAVPDLSTITEMSKENDENSRKTNFDSPDCNYTKNDLDSQSLF